MAKKRVILIKGSRLLREMLQHVLNKAHNLEVLQETPKQEDLPSAIARLGPEWVIISSPYNNGAGWLDEYMTQHPSVRFILLSPGSIKMKWQTFQEEDLTHLSLKDFIHVLEKDLQHT